jgi:hypothetical protein
MSASPDRAYHIMGRSMQELLVPAAFAVVCFLAPLWKVQSLLDTRLTRASREKGFSGRVF